LTETTDKKSLDKHELAALIGAVAAEVGDAGGNQAGREAGHEAANEGLVKLVEIPGRRGIGVEPDPPLPGQLARRLASQGIDKLWSHQAKALAAVRRGEHTAVSTGTASGKSLCFNLPVIESILKDRRSRALYLYPTKALAQDQLRALRAFSLTEVAAATYDGDTPTDERASVRKYANIVLSNPDMLHFGMLPAHTRWADFMANLKFVVVDEAHVLKGVFGSHVGNILRRLRRVAAHYGADPVFILTSATFPNPAALGERLVGLPFTEVAEDGSPRGERLFGFWNPPFVDEATGRRGSTNWESARLLGAFAANDVRTIAFAKSRKAAELIARYARSTVSDPDKSDRIVAYRAGYLAEERRSIEKRLFAGELLGVAATSALELGIDVGGLDAVVLNGFPGTVAQVWQQAGRAGRSLQPSIAVLVAREDALDQYYMAHPDVLLSRPLEVALLDTGNPNILEPHLGSAASELPIEVDSLPRFFGPRAAELADRMVEKGDLAIRTTKRDGPKRYHWKRQVPPGAGLDLRSAGHGTYSIVDEQTGALVGTVDGDKAFQQVYPGAVYLHQGENLEVSVLDLNAQVALVGPARGNYYTQSREDSDITILEVKESKRVGAVDMFVGRVQVRRRVVAFARRDIATGEILGLVDLDLPEVALETVAVWYTVEPEVLRRAGIETRALPGALHAAEHAAIGMLPLLAMADRWDIGGVSTAMAVDTGMPTVFIYDGHPGGAGIAERGFALGPQHLKVTLEAMAACPCLDGCPSCVQSPKCGNGNEPLDKHAAIRLLRTILDGQVAYSQAGEADPNPLEVGSTDG
jgi:DEAD/DEAH box helicase domain-containing protein